ncbi:hypothetical protein Xen7305DRAFT_00039570 [Xenococcus sp. PCC 7305]|uniref:hypothetical protein n=1 Tax=Xenococcus sp. PCC 7305 TaxID=102125 RepID=UPI0002ABD801|nr:hypothetical protein [Xenococcus sp. PCC 7305]ELS04229.1 hypothetical protein Xen7305DRAFT_00039570 [Xenococcus sp. PCC 7305]
MSHHIGLNFYKFIFTFVWLFLPIKVAYSQETASEHNIQEHTIRVNQIRNLSTNASALYPIYSPTTSQETQYFHIGQALETPNLSQQKPESVIEDNESWRFKIQPTLLIPFRVRGEVQIDGVFDFSGLENLNLSDVGFRGINIAEFLPSGVTTNDAQLGTIFPQGSAFSSIEYDLDFSDITGLDSVLRLSGRFEASKGPVILIFDAQYTRVKTGGDVTLEANNITTRNNRTIDLNLEVDVESEFVFKNGFFDLAASYRLVDTGKGKEIKNYPILFFEPIAGVRLGFFDIDVELDPGPDISVDEFYAEPLLGGRLGLQASERVTFAVRGDVSGLDIGINPTDLTWNLVAGLEWMLSKTFELRLAYLLEEINADDGDIKVDGDVLSNTGDFDFFNQEQGIWVGFGFHF